MSDNREPSTDSFSKYEPSDVDAELISPSSTRASRSGKAGWKRNIIPSSVMTTVFYGKIGKVGFHTVPPYPYFFLCIFRPISRMVLGAWGKI